MGKQSGLGDGLLIAGYNVSGDINQLGDIGGGMETETLTGIDKHAIERGGLLRDGRINYTAYFNPDAAPAAHQILSTLPTANVDGAYWRGTALGAPVAALVGKQLDYAGNRGDDGSLRFEVQNVGNGFGLEWGVGLTPFIRTDTTSTDGDSVDLGVGDLDFGAQAYIQITAFTGTLASINVQSSDDDGDVDTFANIAALNFAVATGGAPLTARVATSNTTTIERYLRVITSGTFSSLSFALMVNRNQAAGVRF